MLAIILLTFISTGFSFFIFLQGGVLAIILVILIFGLSPKLYFILVLVGFSKFYYDRFREDMDFESLK